jgi:DNA repair exonuclease SbcCD ATPase subunit
MPSALVLPRLTAYDLQGFEPIFRSAVSARLKSGPNLILGGNGLGKTTLMQAVVYGLTGGISEDIEEDKRLRWGHSYFRSRLSPEQSKSATVTVTFQLRDIRITVRRGLLGSRLTGIRVAPGEGWIEDSIAAENVYSEVLSSLGGYPSLADFAFVVHRLLYLPENRRLLAWDTDAQTRLLMLLNADLTTEQDFRAKRRQLKLLDSRKRHIRVQINHAATSLTTLLEEPSDETPEDAEYLEDSHGAELLPVLVQRLSAAAQERIRLAEQVQQLRLPIDALAQQIDELQGQLDRAEAALVSSLLGESEKESNLAIYKLLESGICPACGTRQRELQARARENHRQGNCVLCATDVPHGTHPDVSMIRSQLSEKLAAFYASEDPYAVARERLVIARSREAEIQLEVNKIRFQQPVLVISDSALSVSKRADLARQKLQLEGDEAQLAAQIAELQTELDNQYDRFLAAVAERLTSLKSHYQEYASEFWLVRRNRGWTRARVACQVNDRGRVQGHGRYGSRTIFSW